MCCLLYSYRTRRCFGLLGADAMQDEQLGAAFSTSGNIDQLALRVEGKRVPFHVEIQFTRRAEAGARRHHEERSIRHAVKCALLRVEPELIDASGGRQAR